MCDGAMSNTYANLSRVESIGRKKFLKQTIVTARRSTSWPARRLISQPLKKMRSTASIVVLHFLFFHRFVVTKTIDFCLFQSIENSQPCDENTETDSDQTYLLKDTHVYRAAMNQSVVTLREKVDSPWIWVTRFLPFSYFSLRTQRERVCRKVSSNAGKNKNNNKLNVTNQSLAFHWDNFTRPYFLESLF